MHALMGCMHGWASYCNQARGIQIDTPLAATDMLHMLTCMFLMVLMMPLP